MDRVDGVFGGHAATRRERHLRCLVGPNRRERREWKQQLTICNKVLCFCFCLFLIEINDGTIGERERLLLISSPGNHKRTTSNGGVLRCASKQKERMEER
uniref:Uncharacterized protein n=1 Tax=Lactuca sativa TaxID=4236 RepID=A0A9R1WPS1_LACSA|nr:hypothetical protein LSAT_V11C100036420 [Lactuca sativa]